MTSRDIMTYTGRMFDFFNPKSECICIEDIAHSLACINRYNGHTTVPYSVAEHCVRMSCVIDGLPGDPLVNLLHDSAEAYIGDIVSPQKKGLQWVLPGWSEYEYEYAEGLIMGEIGKALSIPQLSTWIETPTETKRADKIMSATEVRDLMPPGAFGFFKEQGWIPDGVQPLPMEIIPWDWFDAEYWFLRRFKELNNK